jgi:hypothetical protein
MMNLKATQRGVVISGIAILLTAGNYFRLTGTEMIRPIHIVTLLSCGAAIGVFIMSVALYFKSGKDK